MPNPRSRHGIRPFEVRGILFEVIRNPGMETCPGGLSGREFLRLIPVPAVIRFWNMVRSKNNMCT